MSHPSSVRARRLAATAIPIATISLLTGAPSSSSTRTPAEPVPRAARADAARQLESGTICTPGWRPVFGPEPGGSGTVHDVLAFDDGSGVALFVAGEFLNVAGLAVNHVARWDGSTWSALDGGTDGDVDALAVFDDGPDGRVLGTFDEGNGSALYASGTFPKSGGGVGLGLGR